VTYGRIIDDFRAQQNESPPSDEKEARLQGMVLGLIKGNYPKFIKTGLSHLARTGAGQTIARQLGLEAMAHGLPTPPSGTRTIGAGVYPATAAESNGGIQLFLGCTADLLDTETLDATVNLLNAMGIEVEVPEGQSCCGALDQHAGDRSTANALIHQNETAFQSADNKPVISCATGCGAMLKDYGSTPESIGKRHADISTYLSNLHWPEDLHLAPLEGTVLLHTPCSLRNVLKSPLAPAKLLERIPGLKIQAISGDIRCCGAAGSFMLSHPEEAAYYREAILKEAVQSSPQYLVSSNPGCAAHLRAGLKQQGMEVEVIHPVSLIWRQAKIARKPHSKDDS
jgi:glycolate oxidase iron-sulfur subunit